MNPERIKAQVFSFKFTWQFPWKDFLICNVGQLGVGGEEPEQKAAVLPGTGARG